MSPIETLLTRNAERRVKIAVIGDCLIDDYRECACDRISPEGPHPILRELWNLQVPGGAGNTVRQLLPWNTTVHLLGVTDGLTVEVVRNEGISSGFIVSVKCAAFPIRKIRYCVGGNTFIRVDKEQQTWSENAAKQWRVILGDRIEAVVKEGVDAVVVSDYGKVSIDHHVASRILLVTKEANIPLIVDSKNHREWWKGCTVFQTDLLRAKGQSVLEIKRELQAEHVVLTRGAEPPQIASTSVEYRYTIEQIGHPVNAVSVSGAGDHFAAILSLALAHGLPIQDAASLAHESGCVYVTRRYNEPVLPYELHARFDPISAKNQAACQVRDILDRKKPNKIVFANGVFRIPMSHHAYLLDWAKKQGDVLVVGINDDSSASRQKRGEFVLPLKQRMAMLAAMSSVDFVVPFSEYEPFELIRLLKPAILVKGPEFKGQRIPGDDLVSDVRFAPDGPFIGHVTDMVKAIREV